MFFFEIRSPISRNLSYLLGAQVVWGRYNVTSFMVYGGPSLNTVTMDFFLVFRLNAVIQRG